MSRIDETKPIKPVNIGTGEQFHPDFLAIAPNNRMPAIVDTAPADGGVNGGVGDAGTPTPSTSGAST